jgi:inner membrane protein
MGTLKNRGRLKGGLDKCWSSISVSDDKLYAYLILVLVFWLFFMPVSKAFLINQVSGIEETEISYQNTYPESMREFLTAYSFNSTHYKVLEISYISGIKRIEYVEKVSVNGKISNSTTYIQRVKKLYQKGMLQEIDYPAYSVCENNSSVTVTLSDVRNPYFEEWAYFKSFYKFVFDKKSDNYKVYASVQGGREEELNRNWFG